MKPPDLEKLRRSGLISATAREHGRKMARPGAKIEAIARECEEMILDMGGKPAFPAQLSRNHIAALVIGAQPVVPVGRGGKF